MRGKVLVEVAERLFLPLSLLTAMKTNTLSVFVDESGNRDEDSYART